MDKDHDIESRPLDDMPSEDAYAYAVNAVPHTLQIENCSRNYVVDLVESAFIAGRVAGIDEAAAVVDRYASGFTELSLTPGEHIALRHCEMAVRALKGESK